MSGSWKKTQRIKSNIKQIVRKILCLQLEMRMAKLVVHKILIPPIISLLSGSPAQITVSPDRLNLLIPPAILGSTLVLMQRWSCLVSTICHLWASPKFKVQDVRLTRDFPDSWLRPFHLWLDCPHAFGVNHSDFTKRGLIFAYFLFLFVQNLLLPFSESLMRCCLIEIVFSFASL